MNSRIIALLLVFCPVILAGTNVETSLCKSLCELTCTSIVGQSGAEICGLVCREGCKGRERRDASQLFEGDSGRVVIPLPRDFTQYDTNKDGFIQIEEFAELLSLEPFRLDVKKAFFLADSNDDSLVSEVEFLKAPWLFERVHEYTREDVVKMMKNKFLEKARKSLKL